MKQIIFGLSACLLIASCGGRVANPVNATNTYDEKLSCIHLEGEADNNQERLAELSGEKRNKPGENVALVVFVNPVFLDLSPAHKEEMTALFARNKVLLNLLENKNCKQVELPTSKENYKEIIEARNAKLKKEAKMEKE